MRKLFALMLLGLAFMLTACGAGATANQEKKSSESTQTEQADTSSNDGRNSAEEGTLGKYNIQFEKAQRVKSTYEDADLLMVTYTFTNNSKKPVAADIVLTFVAYQDGVVRNQVIDRALTGDSGQRNIRPDSSIECRILFEITSNSDVEVEAKEFFEFAGSKVTKIFTLQ